MPRSALATNKHRPLSKGPRASHELYPAISVVLASSLAVLPIISQNGWWPNFGLVMLLSWRLLRADAWAAWVAAPLGLWNDLVTGSPVGLSVALWTAMMLAMDVVDRRTMWRDYWIEWALAAAFIAVAEIAQWRAAAIAGAPVRFATIWPAVLVSALLFPIAAYLVARLDRWRLGQ
ncbi:rod shape-determining protein MreD [Sphingomonas rhizophila]|uniref:Rod shape-determining protein MreD n=1 Tax=Sphingomonas rhizophila TaxID=2071607 RepID=A0A7G9SD15_9SPHN|nr:rod shape-determining protein MreD [Sphingomonas rhizophila]QNN65740.1 rod shape-determining protein MreD [Sphingomonas rhizophila]